MDNPIKKVLEKVSELLPKPPKPPEPLGSSPYVVSVTYREKAIFQGESIALNRDVGLTDGEVTYVSNGEKKRTTVKLWNAAVANTKYEIKG